MKKIFYTVIICMSFLVVCSPLKYNYAKITVVNKWTTSLMYKGFYLDENYSDNTADNTANKVVKIIYPISKEINPNQKESFEINWSTSSNYIVAKVAWGRSSVYERSSDFFKVNDGENITIDLSTDKSSKGFVIYR